MLLALERGSVHYVLVGGVAAIIHGAELTTRDVDIVPERSHENLARLRVVLEELDTKVRDPAGGELEPDWSAMAGDGHHLLQSRLGPIDVLGIVEGDLDYEALVQRSEVVTDDRLSVRVATLETLIEIKTRLGRPRDRLALPVLIALLRTREA